MMPAFTGLHSSTPVSSVGPVHLACPALQEGAISLAEASMLALIIDSSSLVYLHISQTCLQAARQIQGERDIQMWSMQMETKLTAWTTNQNGTHSYLSLVLSSDSIDFRG